MCERYEGTNSLGSVLLQVSIPLTVKKLRKTKTNKLIQIYSNQVTMT